MCNSSLPRLSSSRPASIPQSLTSSSPLFLVSQVENALKRADRRNNRWRVLPYHSALAPAERAKSLEMFSKPSPKQPVILVCTDRTSRGVDFENADVEHVLLFDFPRDPSEYLRRVGRTGRAGRIGRVTALVLGKQVALARGIMSGNKKGERVHPVPDK